MNSQHWTPLIFCFLATSILTAQVRTAPLTKRDQDIAQANYQKYCALCHGENREGNVADYAPSLKSKSLMSTMPINFMASTIGFGRPNTAMAPYLDEMGGPMSMREIFNLSNWLKFKSGVKPFSLSTSSIDGDINQGATLYNHHCAECHGKKGEGVTAPAIGNSAFLASATDHYIKYAVKYGRDSTAMQSFKDILTDKQMDDLTAFIRSLTSGWQPKPIPLAPFPEPKDYILNPNGESPQFSLIKNRYVPMKQVLQALKQKQKIILLDTRTSSEWHKAHIPGAIPIPYYINESKVANNLPNDDTWIIAYCACPHAASDKIINMLRKKGYKNTAVIDEGFFKWLSAGYPVTGGQLKP